MKATKQATRGQELIHKENQDTLLYYTVASLIAASLFFFAYYLLFESSWKVWGGFASSIFVQLSAILFMKSGVKCVKGPRGQIIDAGVDLNDPNALGEYCKDVIILCVISQLLGLLTSYFLLLLAAFPVYGEPPEEDPMDEKRNRRRQNKQVIYRR